MSYILEFIATEHLQCMYEAMEVIIIIIMLIMFLLYFQLSIPKDLDEITTGLVKAIDRADNNEDQSEQNLNLILKIITNIADYCRNDNVSTKQ